MSITFFRSYCYELHQQRVICLNVGLLCSLQGLWPWSPHYSWRACTVASVFLMLLKMIENLGHQPAIKIILPPNSSCWLNQLVISQWFSCSSDAVSAIGLSTRRGILLNARPLADHRNTHSHWASKHRRRSERMANNIMYIETIETQRLCAVCSLNVKKKQCNKCNVALHIHCLEQSHEI